MTVLIKNLHHMNLKTLDLSGNNLGSDIALHLSKILPHTNITSLNLQNNNLGDLGGIALSITLDKTRVIDLNLEQNDLTDHCVTTLIESMKKIDFICINASCNDINKKIIDESLAIMVNNIGIAIIKTMNKDYILEDFSNVVISLAAFKNLESIKGYIVSFIEKISCDSQYKNFKILEILTEKMRIITTENYDKRTFNLRLMIL